MGEGGVEIKEKEGRRERKGEGKRVPTSPNFPRHPLELRGRVVVEGEREFHSRTLSDKVSRAEEREFQDFFLPLPSLLPLLPLFPYSEVLAFFPGHTPENSGKRVS